MTIEREVAMLREAGLDLAHAFDAHAMASVPGWEMLASAPPLGLLIGNTRALWPPFAAAMRDPALAARANPLERFVETAIDRAFPAARIYYSHRTYERPSAPPTFLPFQKLAVATGLGALSDAGLVIHPEYGPWLALRAVVVIDGQPVSRSPIAKPCMCDARCGEALDVALGGGDWRAWLAVRDSCTLRKHRYDDDQIRYHYTKAWER